MDGRRNNWVREVSGRWLRFRAWGHRNVRATHRSTIEITREESLTPRGDCIIGVRSQVAAADLPQWFREAARSEDAIIMVVLCVGEVCDGIVGRGSPDLIIGDGTRMIIRRSSYIEPATIMIKANKAAIDIRRDIVNSLSKGMALDVFITAINQAA